MQGSNKNSMEEVVARWILERSASSDVLPDLPQLLLKDEASTSEAETLGPYIKASLLLPAPFAQPFLDGTGGGLFVRLINQLPTPQLGDRIRSHPVDYY
ncbi:hypothetical protein TNCV_4230981 [Trichonephila clavipes]|uniref:Uncharacterized protein n=1 Tax=Trichonephila clavipes TaxID=2585209 RepID=A0A8X6VGA4_TRICX|nr:hypothetical protein TNCV_4230981 [Trichonephila clavipes]